MHSFDNLQRNIWDTKFTHSWTIPWHFLLNIHFVSHFAFETNHKTTEWKSKNRFVYSEISYKKRVYKNHPKSKNYYWWFESWNCPLFSATYSVCIRITKHVCIYVCILYWIGYSRKFVWLTCYEWYSDGFVSNLADDPSMWNGTQYNNNNQSSWFMTLSIISDCVYKYTYVEWWKCWIVQGKANDSW